MTTVEIQTPRWVLPLLKPARYKGVFGGRASGKSHAIAEYVVERMVVDPDLKVVCIREFQKSLKFSVKALLEKKIEVLGVSHLFEVLNTEIRRKDGDGLILFQGMQSHNSDSIKSLEGFSLCWVEEAQNLSARSLQLLRPTIRAPGSEMIFTWNPESADDAVDSFFRGQQGAPKDSVVVRVNYDDNPFLPAEMVSEMEIDRQRDADYYHHVWMGGYNIKSELQVLAGKWRIEEFDPGSDWDGPYFGVDWGFANDPTAAIKAWIHNRVLFVEYESWALHLELDDTAKRWIQDIPDIEKYTVRADCSRPESISHVKTSRGDRLCIPRLTAAQKWAGSVEDGVAYLRNFDSIIVHPRCKRYQEECRLYSYKTNSAGDILPEIVDKHNHLNDSLRYALQPLIKKSVDNLKRWAIANSTYSY